MDFYGSHKNKTILLKPLFMKTNTHIGICLYLFKLALYEAQKKNSRKYGMRVLKT